MITLKPILRIFMILNLILLHIYSDAQEKSKVQFGKVSPADFILPTSSVIDSNANAVILADIGSLHFVGNKRDWFSHVFKKQTRVKIINKKAFDLTRVKIPIYILNNGDAEKVDNLTASTFNLENGQVVETKLGKSDIFEDKRDKNHSEIGFTMPAVKEGSIIEYSYTVTSELYRFLPDWAFQSGKYPCLWSEYEVAIPQTLFYTLVRQGVHTFAIDKASVGTDSYRVTSAPDKTSLNEQSQDYIVTANIVKHRWVMKDIPAFQVESYISNPDNYIDKVAFQLSKTYTGDEYHDVSDTWKGVTRDLLAEEYFGEAIRADNEWLLELLDKVGGTNQDPLEKTKTLYNYVKDHFTCTDHNDKYINTTLQDVVKKGSGTVGDLNLLLVAMLRRMGITADPVLLSTREAGFNLASYPMLDRMNYVIARVQVNGQVYFLDAARPQLGFGQLAGNCYNGHARIISQKDSASVYFVADSLKENTMTSVLISATEKGLEGRYESTLGVQESYNTRERITEIGGEKYFKNIQTSFGDDLEISNTGIDSLKRPDDPLKVYYDFGLKQPAESSILYFSPMMWEGWRNNPFSALERKYPVEMPYVIDDMYIFSMEVPAGYAVDELPKSARVALNGDQGSFEYLVANQNDMVQLRCHLKVNRAYFSPDNYNNLRDFFAYVVKKESEQIVLKKK
jgi:hypothetical protein